MRKHELRDLIISIVAVALFVLAHGYVDRMDLEEQAMQQATTKQVNNQPN